MHFANFLRLFKNISGRMLQEKHWTSPKAVPIAFPVNFFTTGWQKGLELFFFFFEVRLQQIREYFYRTFYQTIMGIYISMAL